MQQLHLGELAFYWRMTDYPNRPPNPVPDFVEFEFSFLPEYQLLVQTRNAKTCEYLETVYREHYNVGYLQEGHALADSYGGEFIAFIESALPKHNSTARRISEIGAGGGYILKSLKESGYQLAAIDPSPIAVLKGKELGIEVIPQFYPASMPIAASDVIIHYDVLEHVPDPVDFLRHHVSDLNPGGLVVFAVPDCSPYIAYGDVSMILHEHLNYFDIESLSNVVQAAGLAILELRKSEYGGVLLCVARSSIQSQIMHAACGTGKFESFARRVRRIRDQVEEFVAAGLRQPNSLGCYVPLRALPYLSMLGLKEGFRFFDDNGGIHGKYFDGFNVRVESIDELAANPVSHVLIMSHAFGNVIRTRLRQRVRGHDMEFLTLTDMDPQQAERLTTDGSLSVPIRQ